MILHGIGCECAICAKERGHFGVNVERGRYYNKRGDLFVALSVELRSGDWYVNCIRFNHNHENLVEFAEVLLERWNGRPTIIPADQDATS